MFSNVDLYSILRILNLVIFYFGLAVFCLGGCINSSKRCNGQFIFPQGLATCSFGGLTRDIALTPLFAGMYVIPGLVYDTATWLIAIIIVGMFKIIYANGKQYIFDDERFAFPFLVLDSLALGNFTVIGVEKAIALGIISPAAKILFGIVTATGGGVFSILMWGGHKARLKLMKANVWYYLTAATSSCIACYSIARGFNREAVYLACSAFCATVFVIRKAVLEGVRSAYISSLYCRNYTSLPTYMRRLRRGEYFHLIKYIPHERSRLSSFLNRQHRVMYGVCSSC